MAAAMFLGQLLSGIQHPAHVPDDEPTVSAETIAPVEGEDAVETVLVLPSGDKFRVTVEWLSEESP
jgi:hypothetical protein